MPPRRDWDLASLKNLILQNKDVILDTDEKIVPATNPIWQNLSYAIGIKATSIHSYVINNRYELKNILTGKSNVTLNNSMNTTSGNTSLDESLINKRRFQFAITKSEFEDLITEVIHKSSNKKGHHRERLRKVLKPNVWTEKISAAVWNSLKLRHAFHFKGHYLVQSGGGGKIKGHCNCGALLSVDIDNYSNEFQTFLECIIENNGEGENCGKRQLRGLKRKEIANETEEKSIDVFISQEKRKFQDQGDPEPPIVYSDTVLRNLKSKHKSDKYLHSNPIEALKIMKRSAIGKNVIHSIGDDEFFIHINSSYQINLWNLYYDKVPLLVDSSSGIAPKFYKFPKEKCHSLFIHVAAINCEKGQFAVGLAITEFQDALTIETWLKRFLQFGANYPKQVVCDGSRALETACISAFTNYLVIENYCDMFLSHPELMEKVTFVSKDVAHNVKLWASFLSGKNKRIKIFYMASIGQLILSNNLEEFENILTMLFAVSLGETEGTMENGKDTYTQQCKNRLKDLIIGEIEKYECNYEELENKNSSDDELSEFGEEFNYVKEGEKRRKTNNIISAWETWAIEVRVKVQKRIEGEIGNVDNAHCDERIATRLQNEIRTLPMWTNVFNKKFNIKNVHPSSSASVECEIRKIKNNVLGKKGKTTRIDMTVEKIIKYYDGRLRFLPRENSDNEDISSDLKDTTALEDNQKSNIASDVILHAQKKTDYYIETEEITFNRSANNESIINTSDISINTTVGLNDSFIKYISTSGNLNETLPFEDLTNNFIECIACRKGDKPSGAHKCRICLKNVHVLPGCSLSSEEEGYGSRVVCVTCFDSEDLSKKLALSEIENHNGLALTDIKNNRKQKEKKNLYLGQSKEKIKDRLAFENNAVNIPILKNGSTMKLKLIVIDGGKYSFQYTCAFDSIFQMFFVGCTDNSDLREYIKCNASTCEFFEMVNHSLDKGLSKNAYRLRARILLRYKNIPINHNDLKSVKCDTPIDTLVNFILKYHASIQRKLICTKGCEDRFTDECTAIVPTSTYKNNTNFLQHIIRNYTAPRNCPNCHSPVTTEITTGQLIIVETYERPGQAELSLEEVPKMFTIESDTYKLIGIINYDGPEDKVVIGHYTTILFRDSWMEYDDYKDSPKKLSTKTVIKPKIVCYMKSNNKKQQLITYQ